MAKKEVQSLSDIMKNINKEWGGDIIRKGVSQYDYRRIPFTSPRLNYITYGGLPMGKLIDFSGKQHSGKTTSALDNLANYQHMEDAKTVLYVDAENTLDTVWATKLGVDVDNMIIMNPTTQGAETIFEQILRIIETGEIGYVVIDSLGVMMSNQAYEKSVEDRTYGGISMALTRFSKEAEALCHKHDCTLIGINQMRVDLNSQYGGMTTTGGQAWQHNTSVQLEFRRGKFFDEKYKDLSRGAENPMGNFVEVAMLKNKFCPPKRRVGFYTLRYDIGVDYMYDLIEVCGKYNVIEPSGSWYSLKNPETLEEIKKLQGEYAVSNFLSNEENTEILKMYEDFLDKKIKED